MDHEQEYVASLDAPRRQAIAERYLTATCIMAPSEEEPGVTHITALVDLDDPDAVTDLTIERELALHIDQGIPVVAIPIRTPERTEAPRTRLAQRHRRAPTLPPLPLPLNSSACAQNRETNRNAIHACSNVPNVRTIRNRDWPHIWVSTCSRSPRCTRFVKVVSWAGASRPLTPSG